MLIFIPSQIHAQTGMTLRVTSNPELAIGYRVVSNDSSTDYDFGETVTFNADDELIIQPDDLPFGYELALTTCSSDDLTFTQLQTFGYVLLSNFSGPSDGEIVCTAEYRSDDLPWFITIDNTVINNDGGFNGPSDFIASVNGEYVTWLQETPFYPVVVNNQGFVTIELEGASNYKVALACKQGQVALTPISREGAKFEYELESLDSGVRNIDCGFTVDDIGSSLTIDATVVDLEGDANKDDFTFTLLGDTYSFPSTIDIAAGQSYVVEVNTIEGYSSSVQCEGFENGFLFSVDSNMFGLNLIEVETQVDVKCAVTLTEQEDEQTSTTTTEQDNTSSTTEDTTSSTTSTTQPTTTTTTTTSTTSTTNSETLPNTGGATENILWFALFFISASLFTQYKIKVGKWGNNTSTSE